MGDNFGPNNVYANIPRVDSHGRSQIPMFMRWNSDPIGNDASNLAAVQPGMQNVVNRARADNPNLNFVIGNGRRTAADQDWAKSVGWSQVGSKDGGDANVHMNGQAVDLWGLDGNGRVQFNPSQQQQISLAMKKAAQETNTPIAWGGDFKTFKDAPHFELAGGGSAASSGAPEGPTGASAAPAQPSQSPPGTTLNSSVIDALGRNIASIESGGSKNPYGILGPQVGAAGGHPAGQAIGKYQVMSYNVGPWTQQALGKTMTPQEFAANPSAQEAVFRDQMTRTLANNSPADAASIWFTGKPVSQAGGAAKDVLGTTNASYVSRATAGIPNAGTMLAAGSTPVPGSTINTTGGPVAGSQTGSPTGGPTVAAGGVASTPGSSSTGQPGQAPGGWMGKLASALPKPPGQDKGGGGGDEPPQAPPSMQLPQAQAMGGPMMMRPGGMNMQARAAAPNSLAQQAYLTAAYGAPPNPLAGSPPAPGAATGMPSMPGTTLNSPGQLQMALMTGAMSPYDLYANQAAASGIGSM